MARAYSPRVRILAVIGATALLAVAGCGSDGNGYSSSPASTASTTTTAPAPRPSTATTAPETTKPDRPKRRERTPASLAACIREDSGVAQVLVKARDNEDAMFFQDLVGGRVDTVAVTARGQSAEIDVFLFPSPAGAKKAAPQAGGQGLKATVSGSAVVVAPGAPPAGVASCLSATGYAAG
jgi:hypothetical protein